MLLQRYPGYTVSTLLAEDADVVRMLTDVANAARAHTPQTGGKTRG